MYIALGSAATPHAGTLAPDRRPLDIREAETGTEYGGQSALKVQKLTSPLDPDRVVAATPRGFLCPPALRLSRICLLAKRALVQSQLLSVQSPPLLETGALTINHPETLNGSVGAATLGPRRVLAVLCEPYSNINHNQRFDVVFTLGRLCSSTGHGCQSSRPQPFASAPLWLRPCAITVVAV
jgi:hypothetical protein